MNIHTRNRLLRQAMCLAACAAAAVGCGKGSTSNLGDPPSALLAQPCTITSGNMTVMISAGETAYVSYRVVDNMIVANAIQASKAECATARTNTLTVIGSSGADTLYLDLFDAPDTSAGWPVATTSFVPITVDLKGGNDLVKVRGTVGIDTWTLGAAGLNLQATPDLLPDLMLAGVEAVTVGMEAGNDVFTAAGGAGTGDVFAGTLTVFGDDGDDTITGGVPASGMNELWGGNGDDRFIQGAKGQDHIHGEASTAGIGDTIDYSARINALVIDLASGAAVSGEGLGATGENDKIESDVENAIGGAGDDVITGNAADNVLTGMAGNDTIYGGAGADHIYGCAGHDIVQGGAGDDFLDGNGLSSCTVGTIVAPGVSGDSDTLDYSDKSAAEPVSVVITDGATTNGGSGSENDTVKNFINVNGGDGNDFITGSASANILRGGNGDDTIHGGGGNDFIYGQAGADTLFGGTGVDMLDGGSGVDVLDGIAGADALVGGPARIPGVPDADAFVCHAGQKAVIIDFTAADIAGVDTIHNNAATSLSDCTTHF